jgi:hypothetical protein
VAAAEQAEQESHSRFKPVDDTDVEKLLQDQQNKRTKTKTEGHMRLLYDFLQSRDEDRKPEDMPTNELNKFLCLFFLSVRKENGEDYEPSSLKGMQSSFERHLKANGYKHSIITHIDFERSRSVLASRQKELKKEGKGNRPKAAKALTEEEREELYTSRQLGVHSPQALINTMWLNTTIHFGLRGVDEHRKLKWGDVVMGEDNTGQSFLEFNERETKTRTGRHYSFNLRKISQKIKFINYTYIEDDY